MTEQQLPEQSACPKCGVPGPAHGDIIGCADALIAYYAQDPGTRAAMERALGEVGMDPQDFIPDSSS